MPIKLQHRINRSDLKSNPNSLYVFGDNMEHRGYGGQAKEMRGEPNAIGIPTKWSPDTTKEAYFSDDDFTWTVLAEIDDAFARLSDALYDDHTVVIPTDGVGTGLADLKNKAPEIYKYIQERFADLDKVVLEVEAT